MKKLLLIICLIATFAISANAQINEGFKVDWGIIGIGFGGKSNGGDISGRGGIGIFLEPRYGLNEKFTLGFRGGADILGSGDKSGMFTNANFSLSSISSYLATAEYHFSTNKFRPFFGLGMGLYSTDVASINGGESSSSAFGTMPRLGFNLGHFRMIYHYNLPFDDGMPKYSMLSIGVEFGGGS
ncbi:MAG: outer membrane beta-barrel protein [Ekhidna sp.]|nr:outer membrane beta-barrel protein [Ekhidna sp.]